MHTGEKRSSSALGDFMIENMDVILAEWEHFLRKFWQGPLPGSATLRNHARVLLKALAEDIAALHHGAGCNTMSHDEPANHHFAMHKATSGHPPARACEGFDIGRMVAEIRAMRAAVTHVWRANLAMPPKQEIEDLDRFHEALDQWVAASVKACSERVDRSRRHSLGILGHELRQPLYSIMIFTEVLTKPSMRPDDTAKILSKVKNCCDLMGRMLGDLLDFTTMQLGCAMQLHCAVSNLEVICHETLIEARTAAPRQDFIVQSSGDLDGRWDVSRLRQLCSNLLTNASHYGSPDHPVTLTLRGSEAEVALTVHSRGEPIPRESMDNLFEPMVHTTSSEDLPQGRVGLGLYLCRQIAVAHGGSIRAESSMETGTTMTVILPKGLASQNHPHS